MKLVVGHLYPRLMNVYGDRGNVLCLMQRCRWRGIDVAVREFSLGPAPDLADCDLFFIGGSQDKEQVTVAADMVEFKGTAIRDAVEGGAALLAICGGYQLMGHYYRPPTGPDLPGIGLFDIRTEPRRRGPQRLIGNLVAEWDGAPLVGFENHGGRTYLGDAAMPLARVAVGYGNNGEDGTEGACYKAAFGTYLHGSFLPKNPAFADHLLRLALARRYGDVALTPLDDTVEQAALRAAMRRAYGDASLLLRLRRLLGRGGAPSWRRASR